MSHSYVSKPLVCQALIGRETEMSLLAEALRQAEQGRPQLVMLAGEAGLGKTRLCEELAQLAAELPGAQVLWGQARLSDRAWPFGPFLDAFRRYFGTNVGLNQTVLAYFLRLLPELTPFFPDIKPLELNTQGSPAQQQNQLFHTLLSGIQALIDQQACRPLLLILEDLHWADESSLEFLAFLARQLGVNGNGAAPGADYPPLPIILVGTYRSELLLASPGGEVASQGRLARLLLQLASQRQLYELRLSPLSVAEHRRLLSDVLGQSLPDECARLLFEWDEGNPFYAEELIAAMVADGQLSLQEGSWQHPPGFELSLPLSLKASIIERVVSLPENAQTALACAAVIGQEFDFELLAALSGLSERELLDVLRQAISLQLLAEDSALFARSAERYQFRHTLTRETIYAEMLVRERRALHCALAETLEKKLQVEAAQRQSPGFNGFAPSFDLASLSFSLRPLIAEHYWLAGLPERAAPYALQEAWRAAHLLAFREERYYLQIALAAMEEQNPERWPLLERLGSLSLMVQEVALALDWLWQAVEGYRQAGQSRRAAGVLASLSYVIWFFDSQQLPPLLAELGAAAHVIAHDPDPAAQDLNALLVYAQMALSLAIADQHSQAAQWVARSMALAAQLEDEGKYGSIQLCLLASGISQVDGSAEEVAIGLASIRQVLNFGQQHHLSDLVVLSYHALVSSLLSLGYSDSLPLSASVLDFDFVLTGLFEPWEVSGASWPSGSLFERLSRINLAWQCYFYGDLSQTEWDQEDIVVRLRQDIKQNERFGRSSLPTLSALDRIPLAHFLIARYELEEAQFHLETALPKIEPLGQFTYLALTLWGFARLHTMANQPDPALEYYERVLTLWQATEDTGTIIPILLDGIEFMVDNDHLLKADSWLAELRQLVEATSNPLAKAAWLEATGALAAHPALPLKGSKRLAINSLRQAVEAWEGLKRRPQQAKASVRLAQLLLEQAGAKATRGANSLRQEAARLLAWAASEYEHLKMPLAWHEVEALRGEAQLHVPCQRPGPGVEARPLTQREMQVLLHLAVGMSNKEIGVALKITEGTVASHVTHILAKLGCATRTQVAAYALEQGWVNASG
jgi:DNA-binding CsgD family transcriptional regulator